MTTPPAGEPIDFSTAPPGAAVAPTCAGCKRTLADEYWTIGRAVVCASCRDRIIADEEAKKSHRFAQATLFGVGGMLAGALAWYLVEKVLNVESGFIAILLGYLVGRAIRRGSENRGGLQYQILAVALTYLGICLAYTPFLIEARQAALGGIGLGIGSMIYEILGLPVRVVSGGSGGIISLVIYGIAFMQAWRLTAGVPLTSSGPFKVAAGPAPA
jgi:DNA-directed RNA polymerase subunit RPC12/RpoP